MATASHTAATRVARKPEPKPDLSPIIPPFPVRRFTVDEYHRMLKCGILIDREPYELIHGWIVPKMGVNPPHNYTLTKLMKWFVRLCGPTGSIRIQMPITTKESEPEPDLVLAGGSDEDYAERNPKPAEVLVLVEVSDSSLRYDRTTKLEIYANAGIKVYWIVNLIDRRVEVQTGPDASGGNKPSYKKVRHFGAETEIPLVIGGKVRGRIPVKELLA